MVFDKLIVINAHGLAGDCSSVVQVSVIVQGYCLQGWETCCRVKSHIKLHHQVSMSSEVRLKRKEKHCSGEKGSDQTSFSEERHYPEPFYTSSVSSVQLILDPLLV